jgi:hypothetical protein
MATISHRNAVSLVLCPALHSYQAHEFFSEYLYFAKS